MQFYTGSFWHPVQYLVGWYNRTTWPEVPIGLGNSKSPESHEISWKWRVSPKIQLQILNNLPLPENQLPFTHKPKSPISSHPQIKPHLQPLRLLRCCCLACLHCTPAMLGKAGDCWVVWEGRFVLGLIIIRFAFLILFQWKMHKNDTPAIRLPFPIENGISDLQSVRSIFLGGEATARKQDWHQIHPWKLMATMKKSPKVKWKIIWTIHLLFWKQSRSFSRVVVKPTICNTCGHLWRQHLGSSDVLGCWVVISPNAPAMMIPFKNRNSHKKNTGGNLRHSLQTTN